MDKAPEKLTDIPGLSTWDKQGGIDVDGKHFTWEQVSQDAGLRAVASGQTDTIYKNKAGGYTPNVLEGDFESSISLNKKTGNIEIKAPQFVLDSETFKRNYTDNDTLKNVSQAYKLNPDYKISVTETNKDTGEEEEKQYAIEEYIEKLNEEFTDPEKGMVAYVIALNNQRKDYAQQFGGYGSAFTEQQISMSQDFQGKAIPIPDFMVNFNIAGYPSWLQSIRGDIQDGYIAVEDFNKFYNRDNLDREDIAVILGTLNKYIENAERYGHNPEANYADTYIDEETGEEIANPFRPDELARALALKNYILSHDPEANALQAAWDGAGVFSENFGYGVARVFLNLDNIVEGVVSGGQSHMTQDFIEMFDAYQQDLNNKSMLANDSASVLSFLGTIGGAAAGTWLVGKAGSTILDKAIDFGTSAGAAAEILSKADDISRGAQLMLKINTVAENASIAANIARTWFNSKGVLPFATRFLLDTVHDAMLYDSVNLRKTLEASDQETRDYWLGQLADNAKWWAGMAAAKGLLRGAGKGAKTVATKVGDTSFGQWLNAHASKNINKLAAFIGDKKSALKDRVAGGSLVRKLETQLEKAIDKGDNAKANRLRRKIQQVEWNEQLREARRALGDTQLDSDGLFKLSSESAENFVDAQTRIKALENSIDSYNRNIEFKRQEMIGQQLDPATGRTAFINPSLGGANVKTTDFYMKLSDLNAKYGLSTAEGSLVSQDVTNYLMGRYHQSILQSFAETGGTNAAKAVDALEKVNANLDDLRGRLPDEITRYVDDNYHTYTEFYYRLNEYGKSKGLVDIDRITGYENNPIWRENGYMPIVVEHEQMGRWIANDSRIDAVIEQDFNHFSFNVQRGQNYVDPEMVRQTRISNMAQAEVNVGLWKAYSGFGSSATNELQISGQESAYVRRVNDSRMALDNAVSQNSKAFAENFDVEVQNVKRRKPVKNKTVSVEQRTAAIAGMSPTETRQVLTNKGILTSEKPNLIDNFTDEASFNAWYNSQSKPVKNAVDQVASQNGYVELGDGEDGASKYAALQKGIAADPSGVESSIQRAYLAGNSSFSKSSTMNEALRNMQNGKNAFYDGVVKTEAKGKLRNITNVDVDTLVDDLDRTFRDGLEDYVVGVTSDKGAKQAISALSETANGGEAVGRYIALKQLQESGMDNVYKSIDEQIDVAVKGKKVLSDDVANMKKQAHAMVDSIVENELNNAASVTRTINSALVDGDDIYAKAKSLTDKIEGVKSGIARRDTDVIMYLDDQGRQVFSRVDPAFASLFNYRFKMDKAQASALARANALMSKLFRYGTTSVNLSSFGNQLFRDFGNALVVGGAWQTIKTNADNLVDVFGEEIVEQIKRFDPSGYEFRQVQELAEQTGQTIEQAAVSRELMRGAAISPTTTERTLYKDFMKQAYGNDTENMLTNARTKLQEIVDKYNPEELLNGKRENYLRNRVYANSLNDAMNSGLTLEQSRVWAEFAMNNATTNFSRQLYHMQAIADSTPYFRAAINGTKSFWRMWSLDPVGITGRMMGGLILPAMFLTGASLGDEESKKIYKNIPEYQKAESLVFVINGGVISVPIPQEMANIVAPFRQFVEYLNDANPNDFWELMMNDALGFSPIDLTAFTTIDMDKMINDPTFFDRVDRGVARVFSQMAPIPVKTAYMLATGTDPYSGKKLNDPSYAYWNDETGTVETMDYSQNAFAKWFASLFGDSMNAALAEKIVSGILGSTGSNVLGDLTALIQEGPDAWVESVASNAIGQVTKPFSVEVYDLADSAWKRAVRQLTAEKDAITSSKKWAALNSELSQTKDPEKRQKILAERQNLINDYQQRVADTVKRLSSEYGGTYDRQKFAATIQLLNFNTNPIYQSGSQYSSNLASEAYWDSRDAAIHTMQQLGITGTNDMSIFGYLTTDSSGNPVVRYTSPVAIMDMENQWQNQDDINMANIKALLTSNNMYDAHKSVTEQIQKIYGSKSKLTNQDRATIEAIQINWNAELAKTIAPYVSQMTPEAAINNTKVLNLLYPYIEVPGDWEVNNSGKYVSLGSRGNKKKAYYDSWVKSMFGINDPYKGQY